MSFNDKMTAIANAIRSKTGIADELTLDDMANAINSLPRQYTYAVQFPDGSPGETLYYTDKDLIMRKINRQADGITILHVAADSAIVCDSNSVFDGDTYILPKDTTKYTVLHGSVLFVHGNIELGYADNAPT